MKIQKKLAEIFPTYREAQSRIRWYRLIGLSVKNSLEVYNDDLHVRMIIESDRFEEDLRGLRFDQIELFTYNSKILNLCLSHLKDQGILKRFGDNLWQGTEYNTKSLP
jgi:hypothetical protein